MRISIVLFAVLLAACPKKTTTPPVTDDLDPPGVDDPPKTDDPPQPEGDGIPRFERHLAGTSGMEAYLPRDFGEFEMSQSPDGSDVFSGEMTVGGLLYGCIAVRFEETVGSPDDRAQMLVDYLDYLKVSFEIVDAAGYGLGRTLDSAPSAQGALDYWVDSDGLELQVMGWITSTHLMVLYIGGPDIPQGVHDLYLNGARFPEEG